MFENKNAGGWALALVALGLFIGLVLRDLIRKDNPPEEPTVIAAMMPQEEAPRRTDDLAERFERVTTQCLPFLVSLQHLAAGHGLQPAQFSGVLMSPEGYILTSARHVGEAKHVNVVLSNKKALTGEILGVDGKIDLAVIKVTAKGLKGIRQGNSDDLRPGQLVLALGHAAMDRPAATSGIVSLKGRGNAWLADEEDFVQTDAVINAHNLGGALVDLQGRLVGINRVSLQEERREANYVIPVNLAREVMRRIIAEGKFERGALAAELQELDANLARGLRLQDNGGALVSAVYADAASTMADIQRGDVMMKWGEKKVTSALHLREFVAATKPGTTMPVTIMRSGAELQRAITVLAVHEATPSRLSEHAAPTNPFGLEVESLTPAFLREAKLAMNTHGVVITRTQRGSVAELAGMRAGDLIQEWEGKTVTSVRDFRTRLALASTEPVVLVYVLRGGRNFYCALAVPPQATEQAAL